VSDRNPQADSHSICCNFAQALPPQSTMPETKQASVIVVGAGPVGLLCALRLAKAGSINVTILEAAAAIDQSPRAAAYQPVSVKELDRAGILDDCRKVGTFGTKVCWRKLDGEVIAQLERNVSPEEPYENLLLGQHLLAGVILEHFRECEGSEIYFEKKVVAIEQDGNRGTVVVETESSDGRKESFGADYVVGADGARSMVRRLINVGWEGFTWPENLVACNVYYPFDKYGFHDANFICDKDHWALIAKITRDGMWRVSYGDIGGLTEEELRARTPMKFEAMFPGPRPLEYELAMCSPYKMHQRCASTFRVGRVLLAGDAAHICNPFGGLGLTGGLLDAAALADALIARIEGKASDWILDKYSETRRAIFQNIVNPASAQNKRRLHEGDIDRLVETDPVIMAIRAASASDQQRINGRSELATDMQQYITVGGNEGRSGFEMRVD